MTALDEKRQQRRMLISLPLRRELRAGHMGYQPDALPTEQFCLAIPIRQARAA